MHPTEEKYGRPDYKMYPLVGYSYTILAKIIDDRERVEVNALDVAWSLAETNKEIEEANAQPSPLDDGYMVYAIIKDKVPIHIGIYAGRNAGVMRRHNPVSDAKKKHGDGCAFIVLKYGLSQRQAVQMQQTLKRRFNVHFLLASKQ